MSPADIATGLLSVCGGLIWLMFIVMGAGTVRLVIRHRLTHRRLGLPATGFYATCPMCIDEQEIREMPWGQRWSRNLKRKALKKQEFDVD